MQRFDGLRVAVTGAAGFIGSAVVDRLAQGALGAIAELRLNDVTAFERPNAVVVPGSYAEPNVRDRLIDGGIDVLFHLASLPGGASDRDPALGRTVNLDGSIALFDAVAATGPAVIVYASSIAALGRPDQPVTDATALHPVGTYGTHKVMIELYLADMTRRELVDGRAVRPAGIVARPQGRFAGFATAWMSELFHAALEQRAITVPVRADARIWLQSVDVAAANIIHAARMPAAGLSPRRAWTLPATVVRLESLVAEIARRTGHALQVTYGDAPNDQPPLDVDTALTLGFTSDGDTAALVDAVMARIERKSAGCRVTFYSLLPE